MTPAARRLITLISVAMVVDTAAYATITPLLPDLVEEFGLSKAGAGALSAAYPVGTLVLALPAGLLAARIGAKPTVLASLVVLAGASLVFGLAESSGLLVVSRVLQGVGAAGVWAGGLAWVAASAPREYRAQAIGTAIGAAIAGSLGGPVLGAAADELGRVVVFAMFVALPLALIGALARLAGPASVATPGLAALRVAVTDPRMRIGFGLMVLPSLGFGMINVLVPLRLDDLGAGATAIAAVFLVAVGLEALMSPLAGRLADRHTPLTPARAGLVAGGVGFALLSLPGTALLLGIATIFAASVLGLLWAPAMALLGDRAEAKGMDLAFAFALGNLAWGFGTAIGGSGGGALADATADAVPYLLLSALALVTALRLGTRSGSRTSSMPRSSASARSPGS
ncbi:MAG: MFS transporter [Solirubrobacteraceae bacterium]